MRKITDRRYSLPFVEAISPHASFTTGANQPLLVRGVDRHGDKGDYVVKLRAAGRMSTEASMRELLAAFIATQMDIPVVRPAIIHISAAFLNLLKGTEAWQAASDSLGNNFGSAYLSNYSTIIAHQPLTAHQLPYGQAIFGFDVAIQNPDRTVEKPNMFTDGTDIVIFDHELAFSFLLDIVPNPKPWEPREADLIWIRQHCLLPKIRHKPCDFEDFSRRFDNLDEKFWKTAKNLIPPAWISNQFDRIKQHFTAIRTHRDAFLLELKKLMS